MNLDGSAGVQAQTLTVWRQAKRNNVNCIAYINKLGNNSKKSLKKIFDLAVSSV